MTNEELKRQVLRLDPTARADLARELLRSLDHLSEAEIERLWVEEALRRDRELDAGTARLIPADEVFAAITPDELLAYVESLGLRTDEDSVEIIRAARDSRKPRD